MVDGRQVRLRRLGKKLRIKGQLACRLYTGWRGDPPRFLVIGSQKCGTSTLHGHLVRHPSVRGALRKEVHFFDNNFARGIDWYLAHFPRRLPISKPNCHHQQTWITGEATPYYLFHPRAAQRVHEVLPNAKLIAILRNPVDRAYSQHQFEVRRGFEKLSFRDALEQEEERLRGEEEKLLADDSYRSFSHLHHSYRRRGVYVDQIKRWWDLFPKQQMLILSAERFFAATQDTLSQVIDFLELRRHEFDTRRVQNVGRYDPIEPAIREQLREFYAPHNRALGQLLGTDFDWG